MRRRAALAVAFVVFAGVALLPAGPADAHALLVRSVPAAGAALAEPPRELVLDFTERPDPTLSALHLLDSDGRTLPTGPTQVPPGRTRTLRADVRRTLPTGVYTITWRTVSRDDGHVTGGSVAFGVGATPRPGLAGTASGTTRTPTPPPLGVAGRWLLYLGLAGLLGAALTRLYVAPPAWPRGSYVIASGALAIGGSVLALLAEARGAGGAVPAYARTPHGTALAREVAVCAAAAVAGLVAARVRAHWASGLAAAFVVAALGLHAVSGHAGAARGLRTATIGVQWLHLVAVAAWLGCLAAALSWLRAGVDDLALDDAPRRLSRLATVAVAVVAATGAARALAGVHGWSLLWHSGYGRTVAAKVAVFAVLVALGAANRFRLVPRGDAVPLRRVVTAEVALGVLVFGLSGLLAEQAPAARARPAVAAPAEVAVSGSDYATSVRVRLVAAPGAVGVNELTATVTDYDTGAPVDARRVALRFTYPGRADLGTSTLDLRPVRPGTWTGSGAQLSLDGTWRVVVVVEAATSVEVPLTLATAPPSETLVVDRQATPALYTATFADGTSAQVYLDPAKAGFTQVHVTFFGADGHERPVSSVAVTASRESANTPLTVRRFGPGHFVADATLTAGTWHVAFRAVSGSVTTRGYADVEVRQ